MPALRHRPHVINNLGMRAATAHSDVGSKVPPSVSSFFQFQRFIKAVAHFEYIYIYQLWLIAKYTLLPCFQAWRKALAWQKALLRNDRAKKKAIIYVNTLFFKKNLTVNPTICGDKAIYFLSTNPSICRVSVGTPRYATMIMAIRASPTVL